MSIDYGMGKTNIDTKTGIRFGVIPQNEVLQAWCDSSEDVYPDPQDYFECPECGNSINIDDDINWGDDYKCPECKEEIEIEFPDCMEPSGFKYLSGEYTANSSDCIDIFIIKSPYYTLAEFCSPCAPGAGYLMSEGNVKAYCFGHDWFDDNKAPYKVYSVETGKEVLPE